MEAKLYVGNLSFQTTEDTLLSLFSQAGTVSSVTLIKDKYTGQSKGFAFVEMGNQSEAEQAIKMFNGKSFDNREIKVNIARPREERSSGGYGGSSSRGGYQDRSRRSGSGSRRY